MIVKNEDIFLMDRWSSKEGLRYIIGRAIVSQDEAEERGIIFTLDGKVYSDIDRNYAYYSLEQIRVNKLWESGLHDKYNTPKYFIEWALTKKIDIPWLDYAVSEGYYTPNNLNPVTKKPLSTRTENNYLRLILTLANSIKGFNPKKPYEAAQLIINETGIDISQQTLSDYITKAYTIESQKRD